MNRDFKGIWIPKDIWLTENLTLQEKVFLAEIDSLDNKDGCFAGNQHFAELFGLSKTRVSLVIKSLVDKEMITSLIIYKEGTKQILKRVLKVSYIGYVRNVKYPPQGKLKDNNTINNTTNNTISKSIIRPKTKVFSKEVQNCLEACLRHFPDHLHPSTPKQKENALETIKRLNKIDKLPFEVVEEIVSKTRGDKFWCKNFLSINKLRKKNKEGIMYVVVFNEAIKSKPKPKTFKEIQQAHIEKIMSADVIKNHFR